MPARGSRKVDLLRPVELIHAHLTAALCQEVYRRHRVRERERIWTLARLAEFWTRVGLQAPESLTQALQEEPVPSAIGSGEALPSPQGFFTRCQKMRPEFLRDVHAAFTDRVLAHRTPAFARAVHPLLDRFTGLLALDGSKLDAIAHRLKIPWNTAGAEVMFAAVTHANPRVRIRKPDMHELPFATTTLAAIRVQKRKGPRRARRYCKARRKWKRFPGSRKAPG